MSRPIFLLTDFGGDDFYAGVMRAVAASAAPASRVVDVSHAIRPHDVDEASFVLARTLEYTALDAVIVVVVDPGVGSNRRGLVVDIGGRTLVGPDNGFATDVVVENGAERFVTIDESAAVRATGRPVCGATFHGRDVFVPAAAAIARGALSSDLGQETGGIVLLPDVPSASIDAGRISGTGRHVDRFGNVLTDIPRRLVEQVFPSLDCQVAAGGLDIGPLRRTYADAVPGELLAMINGWGLVEAAARRARAIDRMGAGTARTVRFQLTPS
jgi:S-adenosyl-L-methionine hydrolase (adenosine-forming)